MKNFLTICFLFFTTYSFCQDTIRDSQYNPIAISYADTIIKNLDNVVLFEISGGSIKDINSMTVATYDSSNGSFTDINNDFIGKVENDGDILDLNNNKVGEIGADGVIKDVNGDIIAEAPGVHRSVVAWLFFIGRFL